MQPERLGACPLCDAPRAVHEEIGGGEVTWFKVDDGFHSHPKTLVAGNEAIGLWVRCGSYCSQHLTEGRVPRAIALMYGDMGLIDTLVKVGLFIPAGDDWLLHDFGDYNPTREQVMAERKAAADRQRNARERAKAARQAEALKTADTAKDNDRHAVTNGVTSPEVTGVVTVPPTRPDPTRTSYGSTGTTYAHDQDSAPDGASADGLFPAPPSPPKNVDPMARFREFYDAYPRHVAPGKAERAWEKAVKAGADPAILIENARLFAMERKFSEKKLIPYPATWLNDRRWEDEPDPDYGPPPIDAYAPPVAAPGSAIVPADPFGGDRHMARQSTRYTPKPSTTDQRVAEGLRLAAYYRERGE